MSTRMGVQHEFIGGRLGKGCCIFMVMSSDNNGFINGINVVCKSAKGLHQNVKYRDI